MIRVLHVLGTVNMGGAESRIMELYRCIDRSRVQFDFLIHTKEEGHYSEEIRSLGGRIYSLPRFKAVNIVEYTKAVRDFFNEHKEYNVVHGHMTSTASIYLPIAKSEYAKQGKSLVTAAHARSAGVDEGIKGFATKCIRYPLKNRADYLFTCSKEAGIAVYGNKAVKSGRVWTIPNAIDVKRFEFNPKVRDEVRTELGIDDKFVIGHVGRFGFMKNHIYLVEVFAEICRKNQAAMLVLIGKGEQEENIRNRVKELGLEDRVLFLGSRYDVERYYQAFDYFVFPSTFEGLPGSVAEAQASGLHCLVSDKVTREAALTDLASYRSIEENPQLWAEEILQNAQAALCRENTQKIREAIEAKGFDVRKQALEMAAFYETGKNPPGHVTAKPALMLIVPMLHQGGFERICALTGQLLKDIYDVHLVVFNTDDMIYDVSMLHVIDLQLGAVESKLGKVLNVFKRVRRVRKLKKELGIQISYSFGQTANIVNALSKYKDITWAGIRGYGALSDRREMQLVCRFSDRVISCTKVMKQEIEEQFKLRASATLYNPCDLEQIDRLSSAQINDEVVSFLNRQGKTVVSMGREDDIKYFWHLIKSVYIAKKQIPDVKLMIIGDGDYSEYKKLAADLNMEKDVLFTGVQRNPFALLKAADVYALTSESEGFPNALIEAMACGLPCISVNCKTGPAEILNEDYMKCQNQQELYMADYGIITPVFDSEKNLNPQSFTQEEEIFAEQMVKLLTDDKLYAHYKEMALKRAQEFGTKSYVNNIEALISQEIE